MLPLLAANLVVLLHFGFILFVLFGGLLVLRWRKLIWLHLPLVAWAVLIEFSGWICPLTPLENRLRRMAGVDGYSGGFIEEHLLPLIYPAELTRELQIGIGVGVIFLNVVVYAVFCCKKRS